MKKYFLSAISASLLAIGCGHWRDNSKPTSSETTDVCLEGTYRALPSSFFEDAYEIRPLPAYKLINEICDRVQPVEKDPLKRACLVANRHRPIAAPGEIEVDHPIYDQIWTKETALALAHKLNCPN